MTKRTARGALAGAIAAATIGLLVGAFFVLPDTLTPLVVGAAAGALVWIPVGVLLHRDPPRWRPRA